MSEQATHRPDSISITPTRLVERTRPAEIVPDPGAGSEEFTRPDFEAALDKASRSVKGKYADVLPSSEEFIRDKRREAELEDRPS